MREMKKFSWRPFAVVGVLLATLGGFIYYFVNHPAVREQLTRTSPKVIVILLALYLCGIVAYAMINSATVRLCSITIERFENLLLAAYTAVINFFGPLQSGPAFRAVYLKKRHHINLKQYTLATLVYYFFYGSFSVLLLFSGILKWWLVVLVVALLVAAFIASRSSRLTPHLRGIDLHGWYFLAGATMLQIAIVAAIYFTELSTVAPGTSLSQALIYTGAANLSLFVSITPGAIGFRESFLLFSQNLHHISPNTIVAASILDRAMYISLMLLLAIFIFGTHASRQLKKATEQNPA
jgi:uncharacterized membrane protein YbhN (UPF0104 family)